MLMIGLIAACWFRVAVVMGGLGHRRFVAIPVVRSTVCRTWRAGGGAGDAGLMGGAPVVVMVVMFLFCYQATCSSTSSTEFGVTGGALVTLPEGFFGLCVVGGAVGGTRAVRTQLFSVAVCSSLALPERLLLA